MDYKIEDSKSQYNVEQTTSTVADFSEQNLANQSSEVKVPMYGMEWQTFTGDFSGSTSRPYSVDPYPYGLRVRDVGLKGSLEFALRGDVFDNRGNLYAKMSSNSIKKYTTLNGFMDRANCMLNGNIVSNLALHEGTIYCTLDTGLLAKIDTQKMTVEYETLYEMVGKTFGVDYEPPKTIIIHQNCVIFPCKYNLMKFDLAAKANPLKTIAFNDAKLTNTLVVGGDDIYVLSERCEIHKVSMSQFKNSAYEPNDSNTATYLRKGFLLPKAMVYAQNSLHFRLQTADADKNQIFYINLREFPRGDAFLVSNDTCRARYILPSIQNGKAFVCANANYQITNGNGKLNIDEPKYAACSRACQKSPAGCDSKIVPHILGYEKSMGTIGSDILPGQISFLNQRVSLFQILNVNGRDKLFVITAVYRDYFAARSNDNNIYILERKPDDAKRHF